MLSFVHRKRKFWGILGEEFVATLLITFMIFGFPSHPHQTISPLSMYHPRVVFIKQSYHCYTTCVPLFYKYVTINNDKGKVSSFYVAIITIMIWERNWPPYKYVPYSNCQHGCLNVEIIGIIFATQVYIYRY